MEKEIDNLDIVGITCLVIVFLFCLVCAIWCAIASIQTANSISNLSEWTLIDSGKTIIQKIDNECYPTEYKITIGKTTFDDRYVWTPDTKWDGHSAFKLSYMDINKNYSIYTHKPLFAPWINIPYYLLVVCNEY